MCLRQYNLGSRGHAFVRRSLSDGESLSRYLVEILPIESFPVMAYLPAGVDESLADAPEWALPEWRSEVSAPESVTGVVVPFDESQWPSRSYYRDVLVSALLCWLGADVRHA